MQKLEKYLAVYDLMDHSAKMNGQQTLAVFTMVVCSYTLLFRNVKRQNSQHGFI